MSYATALGRGATARPARRPSAALRWFAVLTLVGLYAVVVLGFLDTATNSALGCGRSFPLCDGRFFPAPTLTSVIEWTHRVVSAFVGVLVAALAVWAWLEARNSAVARALAAIGLGFLVVESAVGALAVLSPEPAAVVALHLGIALTSFGAVAALAAALWRPGAAPPQGDGSQSMEGWRRRLWWVLAFTYAVVYLGALVAQMDAGPACGGWPLCQGGVVPAHWSVPVAVDYVHRLVALGALGVYAGLVRMARPLRGLRPDLYRGAHAVFGLSVLMAGTGAYVVLSGVSLVSTMVHVALMTLLFGTMAYLCAFSLPARAAAAPRGAEGR